MVGRNKMGRRRGCCRVKLTKATEADFPVLEKWIDAKGAEV
jgi:hypothetical protein